MELAASRPPQQGGNVYRQPSVSVNPVAGQRVYKVWKGSNRFYCGGRLVFGPDVRSVFMTLTLIITPVVIFCVFVGRHLMVEFPHRSGLAIMVAVVTHTFFVLTVLFLTSARDPGIVPRNNHPPEPDDDMSSSSDWSGSQTPPKYRLPRTKDVNVNGIVVKVKYCDTCMLYRPPRCSHCSICNNCVERFDHHCPWVGQCIGQRNYPFFFMFVSSSTLLCFFVFAMSALRIKILINGDPPHAVLKALQRSPASVFLMIYTFLASWFVGGLTVFHLYLIGTNQTTYENFRYRYENRTNPYDKGLINNFKDVLCSGIPASKVKFRARVQHEASGIGNYTPKQRESMDIISPKFGKPHSKIEMGSKSSWTATAVGQNIHGSSGGLQKDNKNSFVEAIGKPVIPYDSSRSPAGSYPRPSSRARQSSNWEFSSESLGLSPAFGPPHAAHGNLSPVFGPPHNAGQSNLPPVYGPYGGHSNQRPVYSSSSTNK